MSMFCYQCQEAAKNEACTVKGVCGKLESTANLQDLMIFALKGMALYAEKAIAADAFERDDGRFISEALFVTVTNTNFDNDHISGYIQEALKRRDALKEEFGAELNQPEPDCATWYSEDRDELLEKARDVGVLSTRNEDLRSLRELVVYGLKGLAAYCHHAAVLGYEKDEIY